MYRKLEKNILRHASIGRAIFLAAASACAAAGAAPLSATMVNLVQVTGANGSPGIAAQSATANAQQNNPNNTAIAVGGSGGIFASSVSTSGYAGASATANATSTTNATSPNDANSIAVATGGAGGYETIVSQTGQSENVYGTGGAATATGTAVNYVAGGNATTMLTAIGGNAGNAGAPQAGSAGTPALGGFASATGQAWATGNGTATIIGIVKNGNDSAGTLVDPRTMFIPTASIVAESGTGTANASLTVTGGNAPSPSSFSGQTISATNAVEGTSALSAQNVRIWK